MEKIAWHHIEFEFSKKFTPKRLNAFKAYLGKIILRTQPFMYFFLFEQKPSCFLAIQLYKSELKNFLFPKPPKFISSIKKVYYTSDEANGENFLYVMNSVSNIQIFTEYKEDRFRHLVHCICNNACLDFFEEAEIYGEYQRLRPHL